jgi:hypothetical protein
MMTWALNHGREKMAAVAWDECAAAACCASLSDQWPRYHTHQPHYRADVWPINEGRRVFVQFVANS